MSKEPTICLELSETCKISSKFSIFCQYGPYFCVQFSQIFLKNLFTVHFFAWPYPSFCMVLWEFVHEILYICPVVRKLYFSQYSTSSCGSAQVLARENITKSSVLNLFLTLCVFSHGFLGILPKILPVNCQFFLSKLPVL